MSVTQWLQNSGVIGGTLANMFDNVNGNMYATPEGNDAIPTSTLTKAQKTFSTNAPSPNLPKPKTLYFVYFNLNPDLDKQIDFKQKFIKQVAGTYFETADYADIDGIGGQISKYFKNAEDKILGFGKSLTSFFGGDEEKKAVYKYIEHTKGLEQSSLVDYIPTSDIMRKLSYEMSKLVKKYDKPAPTFTLKELNEYNRKRFIYDGVSYNDVSIDFFDVKENTVQQFFNTYLKFISSDFLCKDKMIWEAPIDNTHWQNKKGYKTADGKNIDGTYLNNLNSFGLNIDSNFQLITSISFCEYYMNKLTVYTIENPKITSISWGSSEAGSYESNTITVKFKYEGITNDLINVEPYNVENWDKNINKIPYVKNMVNREIKADVAKFLQTRYKTLSGELISDAVNIMKGYMNGDKKFSWNSLKNQALDTARKYGFANEANTLVNIKNTIGHFNEKSGKDKAKYLVNISTDPTSVVGRISRGTNNKAGSQLSQNIIL